MADNDNTSRPKSPEELELEKQLAIIKLKGGIAQAQKDIVKGPDVTPLQGNITSDGTFIESRILARKTLREAFEALGAAITASDKFSGGAAVHLILYNAADIPSIELYDGVRRQLVALDSHFARVVAQTGKSHASAFESDLRTLHVAGAANDLLQGASALAAPGLAVAGYAAGAVLRTAVDLVSLFRVDTDFKNFDLPVDDTAMAAEFKKVIPGSWKLWHPMQFPVNIVAAHDAAKSEILELLGKLEDKNAQALGLAERINNNIEELNAGMAAADADKRKTLQAELDKLSRTLAPLDAVSAAFTRIQTYLMGGDDTTKLPTMSVLLRAEQLFAVMKVRGTYVVKLAAVSRGSNKVSKWLWSSAKIRHSAGTELNCLIFSPSGEIVFADTQLRYVDYMKPNEIKEELL